jgi:hypothetical protein
VAVEAREIGGDMAVQRAIKRDLLTGEPIRSDTLHIHVKTLDVDRPEPVVEHDRYPFRSYQPRTRQRELLPDLSELLDDLPRDGQDGDADA